MNQIEITCKGADVLPIDSLEEFQGDLKKITKKNLDKLKKMILKNGFNVPFFVWRVEDWCRILDGHQRLKALLSLREDGYEIPLLPVAYIDAENESDARQKLLGITSQYGEFEVEQLEEWMQELDSEIAESLRFSNEELKIDFNSDDETDGDDEIQEDVPAITKQGDLWELGKHKVLCGDSTIITDVEKLMDGNKADMYLSDPPYNVAYKGKTKDALTIKNDKMDNDKFRLFLKDAFSNIDSFLKPGGVFYIWHADLEGYNFRGACFDIGWRVRQCLIWNKNTMVMGRQDYHWKHEPCLYGWKDGASHLWSSDRKQTTILSFERPTRSTDHPTMKPVNLFAYQIQNNTKGGDLIVDNFLGSGTTLIASEKTGRICYGMELDEHYCDVIVFRWIKFMTENDREIEIRKNGKDINYKELMPDAI